MLYNPVKFACKNTCGSSEGSGVKIVPTWFMEGRLQMIFGAIKILQNRVVTFCLHINIRNYIRNARILEFM